VNTKCYWLGALIGLTLAIAPAHAGNAIDNDGPTTVDLTLAAWTSPVLPQAAFEKTVASPLLAQNDQGGAVDVYGYKRKSPTRAFLQSFLIPGWGQLYAKSSIWKPIMFVGLEAAGWAGYSSFHGKGNDKEEEYQAFADEHWDGARYIDGLYEVFYRRDYPPSIKDQWIDTTTYLTPPDNQNNRFPRSLSHHAWYKEDGSKVEEDEYYENIGKYSQFNFGWDDYPRVDSSDFPENPNDTAKLNYVSPNRRTYLEMRDDANSEFNKANTLLVLTVANHLLSGFWAALDARAYNRAQDQFSNIEPKIRLVKSPSNPKKLMPYVTLGYKF
jgi:hypothetical protein